MTNNTAIVLILLSVGLFYTFTNDQYQVVKKLYVLAGEYQDSLENVSAIEQLRDNLLVSYESLSKSDIDRLNKMLPDNNDTVRLALDLDQIAARHGIAIKKIQTKATAASDPSAIILPSGEVYDKVTVTFSFISNYANFMGLIADLERNLRIMDIKSVSFQTSDTGLYDHNLSLETYWLK